jgi:hypothetical protein
MGLIDRILRKEKQLNISTTQIKSKIYECLREGKLPEQVIEDKRLAGWELLKSKRAAMGYIKYIHRRMEVIRLA